MTGNTPRKNATSISESVYRSLLQWDAINGCSVRRSRLRYLFFCSSSSSSSLEIICALSYYVLNRTFSLPELKIEQRWLLDIIRSKVFSVFCGEVMIFVLLQTVMILPSLSRNLNKRRNRNVSDFPYKWRRCVASIVPLINFSSVDTPRRRLNFFFLLLSLSSPTFTAQPAAYKPANNFRQEKNLFRRQLMMIHLMAQQDLLGISDIWSASNFCAISIFLCLKSKSLHLKKKKKILITLANTVV